jgi:hypothetical protein
MNTLMLANKEPRRPYFVVRSAELLLERSLRSLVQDPETALSALTLQEWGELYQLLTKLAARPDVRVNPQ